MTNDLFLAILSMDAYNRGYGAGVSLPAGTTQIGSATVQTDSTVQLGLANTMAAGFYAVAYAVPASLGLLDAYGTPVTTVIAYRGTDSFTNSPISGASDIVNGHDVVVPGSAQA